MDKSRGFTKDLVTVRPEMDASRGTRASFGPHRNPLWATTDGQTHRPAADLLGRAAANAASSGDPPLTICTVKTWQYVQKRRHPRGRFCPVAPAGQPCRRPSGARKESGYAPDDARHRRYMG